MIRHMVLVRFQETISRQERSALMAELAELRGLIDGALDFRFGVNVSPEEPVVHGFRDGFWFDFADAAARDAYLVHPAHQAVAGRLVASTVDGPEGVVVFDIEL